jgi:hypothetical protein
MKLGVVLGLLLIALGTWIVSGHATYKSKRQMFEVGDMKASVTEVHTIPAWAGYASLVSGVALLLVAAGRRRD